MTTTEASATIEVRDNPDKSRYEVWVDGVRAGHEKYELGEGTIAFVSTIVKPEFGGRGIASTLVERAVADVRARGERRIVAVCHFVQAWFRRHPDQQDLLAPEPVEAEQTAG